MRPVPGKAIGGGSGGSQDLGAGVSAFVHNAVHTVQVMPPEQLLLLVVVVLDGAGVPPKGALATLDASGVRPDKRKPLQVTREGLVRACRAW